MSLAFDRGLQFGFDKAAGEPCRHLSRMDRCRIHASRSRRGFAGCASYDCYGAGQRVSVELFPGRSWRLEPELATEMFGAFASLRDVHELRLLLEQAGRLVLPAALVERRAELAAALEPRTGWTLERLRSLDVTGERARVLAFLSELRPHVPAPRRLALV